MQFNIAQLRNFFFFITKHKVEKIHVTSENFKLTVNTDIIIKKKPNTQTIKINKENKNQQQVTTNTTLSNKNSYSETDAYFTIVSPMIGTFYRSPAPNEPSFIEINDLVSINQTVCIIEAMKMMNHIEADKAGTVKAILVDDASPVEYDQVLVVLE